MRIIIFDKDQEKAHLAMIAAAGKLECIVADVANMQLNKGDALVTAGNSFGIMGGGLDLAVKARFPEAEKRIQNSVRLEYFGELPVGCAVTCFHKDGSRIIYAPTMQVPMRIHNTAHAYYAMLAALREARFGVETLYVPLLGCGAGGLHVNVCILQIFCAIEQWQSTNELGKADSEYSMDWRYARAMHSRWHRMVGIAE